MRSLPIISEGGVALLADFGRGKRVKTTTSRCPACLDRIAAAVFERAGEVWMDKECPEHGRFSALLASDARHYYVADPSVSSLGSCCGSGGHCGDQVANHSCNMLIEITQRCNLSCPTCNAGSFGKERTTSGSRGRSSATLSKSGQSAKLMDQIAPCRRIEVRDVGVEVPVDAE